MFNRLTENARTAVVSSQRSAVERGHARIGTEHLLLGLTLNPDCAAGVLLAAHGIEHSDVARLVDLGTPSAGTAPMGNLPFTAEAKAALEGGRDLADLEGSPRVGTRHILAGLLRDPGSPAFDIVAACGPLQLVLDEALIPSGPPVPPSAVPAGPVGDSPAGPALAALPAVLAENGTSLTDLAMRGELDAVVGREAEIERVVQVLCKRTKNNPVLVGDAGVGKTAVAEGLALRIARGDVPHDLQGTHLLALDMGTLIAGTRYRGDFEAKLKKVMAAVQERQDIVLFLDEMHAMVSAGDAGSGMGASGMLKPVIARGGLRILGATTVDEYRKHVEKDPALERRFCPVDVPEPGREQALAMLEGARGAYEAWHQVTYTTEALRAAVSLTERYVADRRLPDKAFDAMDEAGARAAMRRGKDPDSSRVVLESDIAQVVADSTGITLPGSASAMAAADVLGLEGALSRRVVGQDEAVSALARSLRRIQAGLSDPRRPNGSFLFAGPTGVGKTEMAKAIAEAAYGDDMPLIVFDMSEFSERHTVSRLFGAPPGYVGHDSGGELTEKVRRRPYSVVLLDEIEKAHPDVFNSFLQVLEEGRLTDGSGRTVDFSNTTVIFTSNAGSEQGAVAGFSPGTASDSAAGAARIRAQLKAAFRPEFLNRLDEIVVFNSLTAQDVSRIAELMAGQLESRLREIGRGLIVTDQALSVLSQRGYDPAMGARPLRRAMQDLVEDPISDLILAGDLPPGYCAVLDARDGECFVSAQADVPSVLEQPVLAADAAASSS